MKQPEDTVTAELPLPLPMDANGDVFVPAPSWRQALNAAVAQHPQGKKGVALLLGVSRPYVSRVMTGHMPVAPQSFVDRVTNVLLQVQCPHLQRALPPGECRSYATRTYAQVSQFEVDHWRACRGCVHRPPDAEAQAVAAPKPQHPKKPNPAPEVAHAHAV
jgi:DNA-binding transcriptional regulator YdaS (Cro superfamily)